MITLLGLIGLHASVQRETIQRDMNETLERVEGTLQTVASKNDARNLYTQTMRQYMKILSLKAKLQSEHSEYGVVVDNLLQDPFKMVRALSDGKLEVRTPLIAFVFDRLLHIYQKRHDAVSKNDLFFWLSPMGSDYGYRQANCRAAKAYNYDSPIYL